MVFSVFHSYKKLVLFLKVSIISEDFPMIFKTFRKFLLLLCFKNFLKNSEGFLKIFKAYTLLVLYEYCFSGSG